MYTEVNEEVLAICKDNNYRYPKVIGDKGVCVIAPFIFTTAIMVGLSEHGYKQRYCFPNELINEVLIEFMRWDGTSHPRGQWIKCKGEQEFSNPDYPQDKSHPNWIDPHSEESIKYLLEFVREHGTIEV